jgi:ribosomal protein S18 acetylase RimI-like enzyme
MQIKRDDRVRMERAHVLAWPALSTANIDGWLWRSSGGGSQRANSVSTVDFTGNDLDAAIDAVEARYLALGVSARFQTFDDTVPPGLADALRARGYRESAPTVTMFRRNDTAADGEAFSDVEYRDHPWAEWQSVYLNTVTENRRVINSHILDAIPWPRTFVGLRRGGRIVSTALCVAGFNCAVVECVATDPAERRLGGAQKVLAGVFVWAARQQADLLGLQVVADNVPAMRLYEALDFVPGAVNRFWQRQASSADGDVNP